MYNTQQMCDWFWLNCLTNFSITCRLIIQIARCIRVNLCDCHALRMKIYGLRKWFLASCACSRAQIKRSKQHSICYLFFNFVFIISFVVQLMACSRLNCNYCVYLRSENMPLKCNSQLLSLLRWFILRVKGTKLYCDRKRTTLRSLYLKTCSASVFIKACFCLTAIAAYFGP